MTRQRRRLVVIAAVMAISSLTAGSVGAGGSNAYLVKDLRQDSNSHPQGLTAVGNRVFFSANDGLKGRELFVSDGTYAGTKRVKDIWTGKGSSNPSQLMALGNLLIFIAKDGTNGPGIYSTDGTAAGTKRLARRQICDTEAETSLVVGTVLYFAAIDPGTLKCSLYSTDGTVAGTVLVAASIPGFTRPTAYHGRIFFFNWSCCLDVRLYKTNVSGTGFKLVKKVAPGHGEVGETEVANDLLFFTSTNWSAEDDRPRLWRSDGTGTGTHPVDSTDGQPRQAGYLTNFNNQIYFSALRRDDQDNPIDWGLWKSNGTPAGTQLVKEFGLWQMDLLALGDTLYFLTESSLNLWRSDGTADGTVLAMDAKPYPNELTSLLGQLYFSSCGTEEEHPGCAYGPWLYATNGTNAGTYRIPGVTNAMRLVATTSMLFLTNGGELYAYQP